MLKIFGYGDTLREGFFNKPNDIELLSKNDYRTAYDINRPLKNIYEGVEQLYDFLNVFSNWKLTDNGVFPGSLRHEFGINSSDTVEVTLWNKTLVTPTSIKKVYTKLAPGIAGVSHSDERQDSMIVVHRPNINLLERQLEYILGLFYYDESESVSIKWNQQSNTLKALIKAKHHPEDPIQNIEIGGSWDIESSVGLNTISFLEELYNNDVLNARFVNTLGNDLTQFLVEPIFEITSTGTYYWEIVNGEVSLTTTGTEGFLIGQFDIADLSTLTINNIQQLHRRYGKDVKLEIFGTDPNSYDVSTNGGVVYSIGKGFHIENSAGAIIDISQEGDITINAASGRNMDFGGVNILGIQANIINLESVLNQDGTMNVDATGVGEEFNTNAETHNQIATTQNNTITTKNDTIVTEVRNITGTQTETVSGKQTINSQEELEINTPLLDKNITQEDETIATQNSDVTTRNETTGTHNEHTTGKKTLDVDTELEINTPLLDKNVTQEDETIATQNSTVTTKNSNVTNKNETVNSEIRNVTTKDETIGTEQKEVTGNRTTTVGGNDSDTITGRKTSNANEQRINGTVDIVLSAPNITLDAGETGTIHIIGEQQTVEGTTVRLEDNILELNKNQTGTPSSGLFSGLEVNRGTLEKAQVLFRESDDTWINGVVGNLKAIANRENNNVVVDTGIPSWDDANKIFATNFKFKHNRATGTVTVDVDNATNTPPFSTNSTAKVANLNVDRVDDVHIDKTGAAAGELATWKDSGTLETSNKLFVTTISSGDTSTDAQIPTAQAVSKFAVMLGSIAVENYSKGIRITYGNGEGTLGVRTVQLANWNVDKVDGVDINNSGAAIGEIAEWGSGTQIRTSNKTFATAFSAIPADLKIPTEKAVKDYIDGRTISLIFLGDTTGTGAIASDGAGNFSGNLTINVKDDSHTHDIRYYEKTVADGRFLGILAKAADSEQLDGLDSLSFLRSDENDSASGIIDFTNTTASTSTTTGAVKVAGGLGVGGDVWANSVHNAVWNDIAEFMYFKEKQSEPGSVLVATNEGVTPSTKRGQKSVIGIHSDTFGYTLGEKEKEKKTPVGLAGRVWVKISEPCKIGDILISSKNGEASVKKWYDFWRTGCVIGKVMKNKTTRKLERIEALILMS